MLESFCDGWGISLDELVKRHTLGQLILMACGSAIRASDLDKEVDAGKSKHEGVKKARFVPNKPFSKMTSAEYRDYMTRAGGNVDIPEGH
jgi:hypothetical protein